MTDRFTWKMGRFYKDGQIMKTTDVLELLNNITPIQDICDKYNIKLEDLPDVLEEYIAYDNAEYLEKLKNQ